MTDCPMEKKPRLWNPGIDSVEVIDFSKESTPASKPSSPESKSGLKPNSPTFGPLPLNPQAATFLQVSSKVFLFENMRVDGVRRNLIRRKDGTMNDSALFIDNDDQAL